MLHDTTSYTAGFFSNHAIIVGGGELSFIDLADHIRNEGCTPVVFVPGEGEVENRLQQRRFTPVRYPLPAIQLASLIHCILAIITIARMLLRYKIQIVHINGARSMLLVGIAARLFSIPAVWHVRVLERDHHLDRFRALLASAIITNSAAVRQSLLPFCPTPAKLHVVYNGIALEAFANATPLDLAQVFSLPALPVVLGVGRLCNWKRLHNLVRACAALKGQCPDFTCLIIGQETEAELLYAAELRSLPATLGCTNVVFGAWRTDVPSIMKAATMLVLPSDNEPFGRVIIEAWACGLPVIATNAGGPAEIIDHRSNGLLVPVDDVPALADAIHLLLSDPGLRSQLSTCGHSGVESFTLAAHGNAIASLHRSLLPSNVS